MEHSALRLLGVLPLALAAALPPYLTAPAPPAAPTATSAPVAPVQHRTLAADPALTSSDLGPGVALLMGGSGAPIPPMKLVQAAFDNYAVPKGFGDYALQVLFTPEGLQPIFSGIKSLPLDTSVAQGVSILNAAIKSQLEAGHNVFVGGVSQSATINAIEMANIANGSLGFTPAPGRLFFLSLGDPSNPNGGLLSRFDLPIGSHPTIGSLDITFSGAAPADTGIPADIYSLEYDGFADFPRYPLNLISDLNAFAGILFVHGRYIEGVTADAVTPEQIANALVLPTSEGYAGNTTYYMMPTDRLPLTELIEQLAGKPLADLLAPELRVIANLGYGADPAVGWSQTPADLPTPFGLFPSVDAAQFGTIVSALADGARQGFADFQSDLSDPATWTPASAPAGLFAAGPGPFDPPSLTAIVNALSSAAAQAYAMLLPTADVLNALLTTLPAHDLSLFLDYLQAGDLINAIGMPIAANVGMGTMAAGIEAMVVLETLPGIQAALSIF